MRNSIKMLLIISIAVLTISQTTQNVDCLPNNLVPRLFDDSMLPEAMRQGPIIEHLGRVLTLKTTFAPKNINKLSTKFGIHTRQGSSHGITFLPYSFHFEETNYGKYQYDLEMLASSGFNASSKTVLMIAGYLSDEVVPWIEEAREKWLLLEDINFIHVTWSDANKYIYSTAVADTPLIARQITIFLYYLYAVNGLYFRDPNVAKRIHFVGHSLGAHIGGFVGKDFDGKLGRITGLDPAGPSFDRFPPSERLDKSDALMVDIIHTNGGTMCYLNAVVSAPITAVDSVINKLPLLNTLGASLAREYSGEGDTAWFGIDKQIGHIDYYANDGRVQPGCNGLLHICDHGRATAIMLDILQHEIALVNIGKKLALRNSSRLLAFNALNYESFQSGSNFETNCGPIMHIAEHLTERVAQSIKYCSIPIDLLTPVDELRKELSTDYNVDFEDKDHQSARQYFFKTLSGDHLVGDHFMLKLYLTGDVIWDEEECSLSADLEMSIFNTISVEMNSIVKSIDGSYPRVIAMPFVSPWGAASRAIINRQFGPYDGAELDEYLKDIKNFIKLKRYLLPARVTIGITDAKSKGVFQAVKNKLKKMIKGRKVANCAIGIGMVEIHPIVEWEKNFAGLYAFENSENEETVYKPIEIYKPEEQVKIPWTDELISRLNTAAVVTTTRKLAAFVINQ